MRVKWMAFVGLLLVASLSGLAQNSGGDHAVVYGDSRTRDLFYRAHYFEYVVTLNDALTKELRALYRKTLDPKNKQFRVRYTNDPSQEELGVVLDDPQKIAKKIIRISNIRWDIEKKQGGPKDLTAWMGRKVFETQGRDLTYDITQKLIFDEEAYQSWKKDQGLKITIPPYFEPALAGRRYLLTGKYFSDNTILDEPIQITYDIGTQTFLLTDMRKGSNRVWGSTPKLLKNNPKTIKLKRTFSGDARLPRWVGKAIYTAGEKAKSTYYEISIAVAPYGFWVSELMRTGKKNQGPYSNVFHNRFYHLVKDEYYKVYQAILDYEEEELDTAELFLALQPDNVEVLKAALKKAPAKSRETLPINYQDALGQSLAMVAAFTGKLKNLKWLIEEGADLSLTTTPP